MVTVNTQQCNHLAEALKSLTMRSDPRLFITTPLDVELRLRTFLLPVAICHQNHTLISKTRDLVGQDYLEHVFLAQALTGGEIVDLDYLAHVSVESLKQKLQSLFTDDTPEQSPMDRVEERAQFLIDIGTVLSEQYSGSLKKLVDSTQGFLINNGDGLYEQLERFEAFRDPAKKKSSLFVKLLLEAELFTLNDPEHLIPPMDYHIQRVLLRTGSITIDDPDLALKLKQKQMLDSDESVRTASIEAIRTIAQFSGKSLFEIDDIFWHVGRSCCKELMLCTDHACNKNPCTLTQALVLASHNRCVLQDVCMGAKDASYRSYWQPIVETHYY